MGLFAVGTDDVDDGLGVVAAIGDQGLDRRKSADQDLDRYLVGGLPGRQNDRLPSSYAPCLGCSVTISQRWQLWQVTWQGALVTGRCSFVSVEMSSQSKIWHPAAYEREKLINVLRDRTRLACG